METQKALQNLRLLGLNSKIDSVTEDAKFALQENYLLAEIVDKIVDRIKNLLEDRSNKIEVSIYDDISRTRWKEFTITVKVESKKGFNEILELWDIIGKEVENIINYEKKVKNNLRDEIEKIDENLAVMVDELWYEV